MAERLAPEWWRPRASESDGVAAVAAAPAPPRSSSAPFWALMVFTGVMLLAPQHSYPVLATMRIALLAAGASITAHVIDCLRRGRALTVVTAEIRLTAALLAWAIVTIPLSYWPGGSVSVLVDLYLKTVAVFLLICNTVNTLPRLRWLLWGLSLMSVPLSVTGVQNFLSGEFARTGDTVHKIIGYEAALTKNPNDLALVLNLILPLAVALLLAARGPLARVALAAIVGLAAVGVVVTFSRAGFLALGTTVLGYVVAMWRRPERGWILAGLVLAVACLPFLPGNYVQFLGTITNIEADPTGSAQARRDQQVAALKHVLANPIVGAGLGMNMLALNEYLGPVWLSVHNVYLQYAVDLGLPGLLLFAALFWRSIMSVRGVRRRAAAVPHAQELFHLARGIEASLYSFAVSAFFAPVGYHFQFYYVAGLAVAVKLVGGVLLLPARARA